MRLIKMKLIKIKLIKMQLIKMRLVKIQSIKNTFKNQNYFVIFDIESHLSFFFRISEAEGEEVDVICFLSIDGPRFNGLRQKLVHPVRRLVRGRAGAAAADSFSSKL